MPKFPEPPARLALPMIPATLPAGTPLWRVYFTASAHATAWDGFRFFGPTHSRFDHHDPPPHAQARGILYAADEPTTCLAEVFQATRIIDRASGAPWLVGFELRRDVVLLDLTGLWPTQAGASTAIHSGQRPRARRWSRAIYAAYANVEGLLYASSTHANRPAVVFYERALPTMPSAPRFNRALSDPTLLHRLAPLAGRLGYGIV